MIKYILLIYLFSAFSYANTKKHETGFLSRLKNLEYSNRIKVKSILNLTTMNAKFASDIEKDDLLKLDPENNNCILVTPHISGWNNNYWIEQSKLALFNFKEFKNENIKKLKNKIL